MLVSHAEFVLGFGGLDGDANIDSDGFALRVGELLVDPCLEEVLVLGGEVGLDREAENLM